jgi:hypothetical protein
MKRTATQDGLDQFLPVALLWMKKMIWRFHLGGTTVYYKQLDGHLIILKVTTGFIQGEHFFGFLVCSGSRPAIPFVIR